MWQKFEYFAGAVGNVTCTGEAEHHGADGRGQAVGGDERGNVSHNVLGLGNRRHHEGRGHVEERSGVAWILSYGMCLLTIARVKAATAGEGGNSR